MTAAQLLAEVQTEFEKELQTKTSWGRNELMLMYERCEVTVLARYTPAITPA